MSTLTCADVITRARAHLMDTSAVSGNILTDAQYLVHVNDALSKLTQMMRGLFHYRIMRDGYVRIFPNINYIQLDTADKFPDFAVCLHLWERAEDSTMNITTWLGTGSPWNLVVASTTGLIAGQNVIIVGASDPRVNGSFVIHDVPDATHINVYGPAGTTSSMPTGGLLSFATAGWNDLGGCEVNYIGEYPQSPMAQIDQYTFVNCGMQLPALQTARQMRMWYMTKSNLASTTADILEIQEGLPLLGLMTAMSAGASVGMNPDRAAELYRQAYGTPGNPADPGLVCLTRRHLSLQLQDSQYIRPLWRPRRAVPTYGTLIRS